MGTLLGITKPFGISNYLITGGQLQYPGKVPSTSWDGIFGMLANRQQCRGLKEQFDIRQLC